MADLTAVTARRHHAGFTLIELAVVLLILGLLIAGLLGPLETQLEARDRAATIATMDEILEALYGFAITNGRLPCPDTTGDGIADPAYDGSQAAATCNADGWVPSVDLNVSSGDAWGNRFRYRVRSTHFTWPDQDGVCDGNDGDGALPYNAPYEFDLCATARIPAGSATPATNEISVATRGDDPGTAGVQGKFGPSTLAGNVVAVVISHGRNGLGATSITGAVRAVPPPATDEAENADGDAVFFSRVYTDDNNACADDTDETTPLCAFDDIVKWVSPTLLNNRMVVAGRLP